MKRIILTIIVIGFLAVSCSGRGSGGVAGGGGIRATPVSDFNYELTSDGKGVKITLYIGDGGAVVIPAEIEGYPVTELGYKAFLGEEKGSYGPGYNITSVVIPENVKEIGSRCFYQIPNLKSVTIKGNGVFIASESFAISRNLTDLNISSEDDALKPSILWGTKMIDAFHDCYALPLAVRARLKEMGFTDL